MESRRVTLDNMGNDLVRLIDGAIGRPPVVSGLSLGGLIGAWLSAYAKPDETIPLLPSMVRRRTRSTVGSSNLVPPFPTAGAFGGT